MKKYWLDQHRPVGVILAICVIAFSITICTFSMAYAQYSSPATPGVGPTPSTPGSIIEISPYFSIDQRTLPDGTGISGYIINAPPSPPAEYKAERLASQISAANATILPNFPSYSWVFGCSAVSSAMVAAYYDRGAYTNIYTGPSNGGVMPITDTSWPLWSDGYTSYPSNPLIASQYGVDGRPVGGSIEDYWVKYGSTDADPYITHGWVQHTWGTAIGDYMKTSQSVSPYNNVDGSTKFYNYTSSSAKLTCTYMESQGIANVDGTYGRYLFYKNRGYTVSDCYNQRTDNSIAGGFSLANFQSEINAGNPVLLNLAGHSIVGYGYNGSTVYIRDTWDSNPDHTYSMTWGGSYQGMGLLSVSVVHLSALLPTHNLFMPLVARSKPVNQSPSDINLSNNTIEENRPVNTVVGTLSTVDPNQGDTFTYSLVNGSGDSGNASFNISGNQLRSSVIFDFESQVSYSIRLRTTDKGGLIFEKVFVINITPVLTEQLLPNGDFEQGRAVWTEYSSNGFALILSQADLIVPSYDGEWAAWLGGYAYESSSVSQQIQVPADRPYLSYRYWIASSDTCGYDAGGVLVNSTNIYSFWLCSDTDTGGWVQKVLDLHAYAGQTVEIKYTASLDRILNSNLFIDHVVFQSSMNASSKGAVGGIKNNPDGDKSSISR